MNLFEKLKLVMSLIGHTITSKKYDVNYVPEKMSSERFISALKAAKWIKDGSTVISTGMAGHARCSIFYWAIAKQFLQAGHPKNLTWVAVSAQGGRGKTKGTLEELALPGLIDTCICGHLETAKAFLEMGSKGLMELHTMPQGEIAFLLEAQAEGTCEIKSKTGIGTFLDPKYGGGTAVTPQAKHTFVKSENQSLVYTLPAIDVALFSAPYADKIGNIYFKNASTITESREAAMAANKNGGRVIAAVCDIIEYNPKEIGLPAEYVDGIVVNPLNEQAGGIRQRKFWPMFTEGAREDIDKALVKTIFVSRLAGITPKRQPVDDALARMAAWLFSKHAKPGDLINLGIGLPEEVGRLLYTGGLYKDLTFSSESGPYGGLPTSGIFFGGAINPRVLKSSAWMFHHYKNNLDIAVLGILQVDSKGNVNVSRRGPKVTDYVGPGGFINISDAAKTVIFIGSWMAKAEFRLAGGQLSLDKPGIPKFVDTLHEVTFNADKALKRGQNVFYVTTVGIFELTRRGIALIAVMPGVEIEKDIIQNSQAKIVLPETGIVPLIPPQVVTGINFSLKWYS
ncbi:MAG: hypothetical protein KKF30_03215 [Proteobacteria bacterium]|nr:hypothetical protein [Pseudomonadota bacterium]MBU4471355.1 hypothetical protein [Pseudomonadota bacterium]MCG2751642.1 hypothetical protein [Desulfobacteraceae bacterium]